MKSEPASVKTKVYSAIPALVSAGVLDPWTRPFYNRLINRTMPNALVIIGTDRAHVASFAKLIPEFIANPYKATDVDSIECDCRIGILTSRKF